MVEATSVPEEPYSWDDWKRIYAVEAASKESQSSKLPGREDGPADAYRHLLWAGELTRRFGERRARQILGAHEIDGRIRGGQSPDAEKMDRHNNELGIALGKSARTWNDVRRVMASNAYQRSGSPEHEIARAKVREWFKSAYGDAPAPVDATGRLVTGGSAIRPSSGPAGGSVHVAAHSREGGKVAVSAYDRSPPSG